MAKVLPVVAAVMVYVSQVLTPLQNLLAMEALERRNLDRAAVSVEVLPLREHTHQIRITSKFGNCADKTCFGSEIGALW
jgi:hypothetical protein